MPNVTPTQRRIVAALLGLTAVLGLVLAFGRDRGSDDDRLAVRGRAENAPTTAPEAPTASTVADPATATTVKLVPLTTGVPVPNAVEAPPPTSAPTATPGAPRAGAANPPATTATATSGGSSTVSAAGAVLTRPSDTTTTRPVDKAKGCNSANDPGWEIEECGALRSGGSVLLWLVETKGKGIRTLVLREQTAGRWVVVLAARDDGGKAFSKIGVRGEDVSGDGQPELIFGFHRQGDDRVLAVDVVDASPAVVVHRELAQGSATASKGRLDTWAANGDAFDQVTIRFVAGQWQASAPQRVARSAVPPSSV